MSATKKTVSKKVKVLPFNKKNAQAFADLIFSDKGGVVTFVKLCEGKLKDGKGGRTLHCAVGEAYHVFVDPNMSKVCRISTEYQPNDLSIDTEGETAKAIEELVSVAQLKKNTPANRQALAEALDSCVSANDDGDGNYLDSFFNRAQSVSDTWRKEVIPLLK